MAEDARKMREDAAGTAKKKLEDASDAGIQNRKWWEEVGDWVTDNWDTIVAVCKVVVAVLGVIAMIIGGPILGAIVLIAALVVLADTLNKYANGEAGLLDVAFAALDCIPGMKALTSLRGLAKGMKGLKAGLKGLGKGGLRKGADDAVAKSKPAKGRCKNGDPIDMVTGEMLMEETDVTLPGILPLVLRRTHLSTYRWGRCFGESWASTLDQRLELDGKGAVFATEDGMLLVYPVPEPGRAVTPVAGPRWPLEWNGTPHGPITISDPHSGLTRRFASPKVRQEDRTGSKEQEQVTLLLQSITDRNGNEITFEYDDEGMPSAVQHTGGYHIAVDTADGRISGLRLLTSDADPDGTQVLRYAYDGVGNLNEIYNSSGLPFQLAYDDDARITSWTDRNGAWYQFTYDEEDRVVQGEGIDGILNCTVTYDVENRTTRYLNSLGHVTTYEHNERLQLIAETDPLGNTVRQEWDDLDRLLARTDQLGNTTQLRWDSSGNLLTVQRPNESASTARFNELNLPIEVSGFDESAWQYEWDDYGNLTKLTTPDGATTHYVPAPNGALSELTDPAGATQKFLSDPAGLMTSAADALGAITRFTYDAFGRTRTVTDPMGATVQLTWTVEGQTATRTTAGGGTESWTYDGEGNRLTTTDAMGRVTRFTYSGFDLMTARTTSDGTRHSFTYDTELQLTQVANPRSFTWDYSYDAVGRLESETDFDGRTITYALDPVGQLLSRTNPMGQSVRFTYDSVGNQASRDVDGVVTTFTHDWSDRLLTAVGPDAALEFQYDRAGRVVAEVVGGRTLSTGFDSLGRRTHRTTPSGSHTAYRYDAVGKRTALTADGVALSSQYDAVGREVTRRYGDHLSLTRTWDSNDQLTSQTLADSRAASPLARRDYSYRADGLPVSLLDQHAGNRTFDLDASGRVSAVRAASWAETYAYDKTGNQTYAAWPGLDVDHESQGDRAHNGNRVTRAGSVHYQYDAAGRVTTRRKPRLSRKAEVWHYAWDGEDRLTAVTTPDGTRWRYHYDALGRRVSKQRLAHTDDTVAEETYFTWDDTQIIEQTTLLGGAESVTLTWEHDADQLLAQTECRTLTDTPQETIDRKFYAIVTDLTGMPTELVSTDGEVGWRTRVSLWGCTTPDPEAKTDMPLRFPGQYHDQESGLHYNYFRHYDPTTGAYVTPDPMGLSPAPNDRSYVPNPLTSYDPLGLAPEGCGPSGGGKSGRKKGLRPDPDAQGPHTTFRRDASTGRVVHYAEWAPQSNPKNPAPWEMVKRADMQGQPHFDKATGDTIPTPHINMPDGSARAAEPWEITPGG